MVEPCKLPCNHLFCIQCINQVFQVKQQCPLCRAECHKDFEPKVDLALQKKIKDQNAQKFNEQYEVLKTQGLLESNKFKVQFSYGNDHKLVENPRNVGRNEELQNKHEWTMFVRLTDKNEDIRNYVSKVRYGLHPTFGVTEIDVKSAPFEMKRIGWGTFNIPIEIHFRKETGKKEPLILDHNLSFSGTGKCKYISVPFNKEIIEKVKESRGFV